MNGLRNQQSLDLLGIKKKEIINPTFSQPFSACFFYFMCPIRIRLSISICYACLQFRKLIQVSKIMNPETLKYLQQDQIGKVIAKGLAHLYAAKPDRPVKNLAEWLKTYSKNQKQLSNIVKSQENRAISQKLLDENKRLEELKKAEQQRVIAEKQKKIDNFKGELLAHDYQQQMLEEIFPEFVEKQTSIVGAYVGYLNHPPRDITDEDTDEMAHLNTAADKLINYIGSSVSHKSLMKGKMLNLNEGVTGKAFSLAEEQAPVVGEDGQEIAQPVKEQYIYVPNVVKNEAMHYFRIPKLGAYLAVPLVYNCYLTEKNFDVALETKNKYLADLTEFNQKKSEQVEEFTTQQQELEKKINDMKEKNAEDPNIQALQTELAEVVEKITAKNAETIEEPSPQLPLQKQSYVFCVDNLGKDKQLEKDDIDLITDLIAAFKKTIEEKEKLLLVRDVETHVELVKEIGKEVQVIKQELSKGIELDEETTKQIAEIEDESLKAYKQEEKEFIALQKCIKQNQVYLNSFCKLKEFRVLKHKEVLQSILFFLGKTKAQINAVGKACLNWKQVKCKLINKETFNDVIDYVVQGAKTGHFTFYAKTPFLTEIFEKFDEDEIFTYNVGLGALTKFIKAALKHRNSNVELRKAQKETERQKRADIIAENEKIQTERVAQLEKHKAALAPEDVEGFNEEEWTAKYAEQHPLTEVPAEIVDDVDNDM